MSKLIESIYQIPYVDFFAVSRDTFMSGWGQSEGRDNFIVCPCESKAEAETVVKNMKDREDQDREHVLRWHEVQSLINDGIGNNTATFSLFSKEENPIWYQSDRPFKKTAGEQKYQGWKNYATWNIALWIDNEAALYNAACEFMRSYRGRTPYKDFIQSMQMESLSTPDGIAYLDKSLSYSELNRFMANKVTGD